MALRLRQQELADELMARGALQVETESNVVMVDSSRRRTRKKSGVAEEALRRKAEKQSLNQARAC